MTFYQTTKLIVFLLVPAVLIGLIFLIFAGQVGIYDSLYYISSPFFKIAGAAGGWLKTGSDFIFEFKSIRGGYERLKEENSELLSRLAETSEIKKENEVLKNQIGGNSAFLEKKIGFTGKKIVFAEIVGRSLSLNEKTIVINKGALSGVAENYPFVYGNFLVGRAVKVYANHSVVALISDPSLKISAVAQNSRAQGIVSARPLTPERSDPPARRLEPSGDWRAGGGREESGVLIFGDVLKDKILNIGDLAVTLGFDGLPKGLILGEIAEVSNADNKLFQSAAVRPLLDIFSIESGFVVVD